MKQIDLRGTEEEIEEQYQLQQKSFHFLQGEFARILIPEEVIGWEFICSEWQKLRLRIQQANPVIPIRSASVVAWIAFEEAIDQAPDQLCEIFAETVADWWKSILPYRAPLYHEIVNIAFDIFRGFSVTEARRFHKEWLQKDESNRIYNDYYYADNGIVINISGKIKIAQA